MAPVRLVCFDMDDTLIRQNSWYKMNIALGITDEEDRQMYDAYTRGELPYEEWTAALVRLYRERGTATWQHVAEVLSVYDLDLNAQTVVAYLRAQGYELALITGSFDMLAARVAEDLGITHVRAGATLVFDEHDLLADVRTAGDESEAKCAFLRELCAETGIGIEECACIADGANDAPMFRLTGRGITFRGSPIESDAWRVVDSLADVQNVL